MVSPPVEVAPAQAQDRPPDGRRSAVRHLAKILVLLLFLVAYFVVFGILFGWHRLHSDWWPLDQSTDGPNLYVSFVWLPIALVGGYIVSDLRHESLLEAQRLQLQEHEKRIDDKLEAHHLSMTKLLGVTNQAVDATPADRSLDDESGH
jgi:lysylphosphatidylglycerol synthetase-like protein (DUF2156 family)